MDQHKKNPAIRRAKGLFGAAYEESDTSSRNFENKRDCIWFANPACSKYNQTDMPFSLGAV